MAHVRPEVYKAIQENDLASVFFVDPLLPVTRQTKRNLLIASFVALLIAILELEISGFLGLQTSNANLGNILAQGLACLIVLYFLISFVFHIFVDYSAWQFEREKQMTQPYLDLISLFEQQVSTTGEQIENACAFLDGVVIEGDMPSQVEAEKKINSALGQLNSIKMHIDSIVQETSPLIVSWAGSIGRMNRLNARLRMRIISLWCLDILLPCILGLLAVWSTHDGILEVMLRIGG